MSCGFLCLAQSATAQLVSVEPIMGIPIITAIRITLHDFIAMSMSIVWVACP